MNAKQITKWWVDVILFTCLIIAFFLDFTGVALHQWIGVFIAALAIYHLLAHWGWVSSVTQRFFGGASGKARLFYLVDAAVLAGLAVIAGTGLVISTWLDLSLANYGAWLAVHITASIVTLVAIIVKLSLHWRWIAGTSRKIFAQPAVSSHRQAPAQPAARAGSMSRQEFIKVMGVVSLASFLALTNASGSLSSLQGTDAAASVDTNQSSSSASGSSVNSSSAGSPSASSPSASSSSSASQLTVDTSSSAASSASSACVVRCGRGCSYPGHCGRYTDSNNNNRCDLGECL
jgi:hypothetical protein